MLMHSDKEMRGSKLLSLLKSSFGRGIGKIDVVHSFVRRTTITSERSSLPRFFALAAAGLLFAALPAIAKPKVVQVAPVQMATIDNTGSTNTAGYRLEISSDGSVKRVYTTAMRVTGVMEKPISAQDVGKLFHDLNAAMPLTALPVRHGMRSASFGTQTYITYKGQRSPDLTFASDPRTVALKADIDSITKTLHVGNAPRRPIGMRPIVIHADR